MKRAIIGDLKSTSVINEMLSDDISKNVIKTYYNRIIGKGDNYTLESAKRTVESHNFKLKKIYRLHDALELVSRCRGISKAMETLQGKELADFKRSLRDLDEIRINPVTIPKEWNIKHIPNLLTAYYRKIADQQAQEYLEQRSLENLKDYIADCKDRKKNWMEELEK